MSIKTSGAFKLSKTAKRALAQILDPEKANQLKRLLIEAEALAQIKPSKREEKNANNRDSI